MASPQRPDYPTNNLDQTYSDKVRVNLRTFHENLDKGNFSVIGSLLAPDYFWNYDGTVILTGEAGAAVLEQSVTTALKGLRAQDIYNIVDGNQGAVLFRISGKQSGPFVGLPLQVDGRYSVRSAETFTFDSKALARQVVTITPIKRMKRQMRGKVELPKVSNETLKASAKNNPRFKALIKQRLASIHLNANNGTLDKIADLAVENVDVDENDTTSQGRKAFVQLVTSQNAGRGSFPNKLFHDFDILVDGKFGAVNFIWQAPQSNKYQDIEVQEGAQVRMRSTLFFEFNEEGLVTKATAVYDEGVVAATLTKRGGYLYP